MNKRNQQTYPDPESTSDSGGLNPDNRITEPLPTLDEETAGNKNHEVQRQSHIPSFPDHEPGGPAAPRRRKKKKKGLIIVLAVLILAAAAGSGYYFWQRQQPIRTVKDFLGAAKAMNFDGMSALLQNNDLTALDDADITNATYANFFSGVNQKMSFDIGKTDFNILNGTANVTAHITYIDGSNIYRDTITEFVKQIVSTAFSGDSLTEEESQQKLASLLEETAASAEDTYAEIDITYPLIKAGGAWKILALDEDTTKMMSANFTTIQNEIDESIAEMENAGSDTPAEAPQAASGDSIDMSNDKFTIHYKQHRVANDFSGAPCLLVYYDYSNNGSSASSAMVDVSLQAYQNGQVLGAAIPEAADEAVDQFMTEVQPGQAVTVCQVFSLIDESDVTLQAGEAFSLGGGTVTTQILQLN